MKQRSENSATVSDRALEMIMRDVLDGLLEVSLESAYGSRNDDMKILEVTPPQKEHSAQSRAADIIHFPARKRACG
ncbi:MAG: hypothetical protein OQL28_04775 [Sedimenticola sp.]|nr:hypothetical protein [Sedimenticola sp.]